MAILGNQKQILLNQVSKSQAVDVNQLVQLIAKYEDLTPEDFKGVIDNAVYNQLSDKLRDPAEVNLWNQIVQAPQSTPQEIQDVQRLLSKYSQTYFNGPKVNEASEMMVKMQTRLQELIEEQERIASAAIEQEEWDKLEKGNYTALQNYKHKYPDSVHKDELDDFMWKNTQAVMNIHSLNRYLSDWPMGRHADEANIALGLIGEWEKVKRSGDIFLVDDFRDSHPDCPFKHDIDSVYYKLRDDELERMRSCPSEYSKEDVEKFINADIFSKWQLIDEELITDESWETLLLDRGLFPNIQDYQVEDEGISAQEGCTDIYLFGTPGTGKTCLLMGLTGANGNGYNLNMKAAGGPYASALQQYVNAGITPGRTFGKFVTTINGHVDENTKSKKIIDHKINLVEMSGEEFALRIADGKGVSLANMGTGATNLMRNNNRKVFFIIVDSTKDMIKVNYIEQVKDAEGNVVEERVRKKYISQLDILNKFVGLFELDENKDIMQRVDAIHFVVTKADFFGGPSERRIKAKELLLSKYAGPVGALKKLCRESKRINYSTNYSPQVFPFSLGKFFLGDVFKFDPTETLSIVQAIRTITGGIKEKTWWDKLKEAIG